VNPAGLIEHSTTGDDMHLPAAVSDAAGISFGRSAASASLDSTSSPRFPAPFNARSSPTSGRRISIHRTRRPTSDTAPASDPLTPNAAFAASLRSPRPAEEKAVLVVSSSVLGSRRNMLHLAEGGSTVSSARAAVAAPPGRKLQQPQDEPLRWQPQAVGSRLSPSHLSPESSRRPDVRDPHSGVASNTQSPRQEQLLPQCPEERGEDLADRLAAFVATRQQVRQRTTDAARSPRGDKPQLSPRPGLRHRSPSRLQMQASGSPLPQSREPRVIAVSSP
jgi:hypothetical protein